MQKVYLAKSNKANPDDVSRVRQILSRFELEVVEYKGGSYSHKQLNECEMLIVVPDLTTFLDDIDNQVVIGKGLYEQINSFNKETEYIFIVTTTENDVKFRFINDDFGSNTDFMEVIDDGDYIDYAILELESNSTELIEFMNEILDFPLEESESVSISKYKYLLIKK